MIRFGTKDNNESLCIDSTITYLSNRKGLVL